VLSGGIKCIRHCLHFFDIFSLDILDFDIFSLDILDFDILDFDILDFDTLDFDTLDFDTLDFDILDFDILDFDSLYFDSLYFDSLDFDSLDFDILDFNIKWGMYVCSFSCRNKVLLMGIVTYIALLFWKIVFFNFNGPYPLKLHKLKYVLVFFQKYVPTYTSTYFCVEIYIHTCSYM
jgi:hypothetical protein